MGETSVHSLVDSRLHQLTRLFEIAERIRCSVAYVCHLPPTGQVPAGQVFHATVRYSFGLAAGGAVLAGRASLFVHSVTLRRTRKQTGLAAGGGRELQMG